MFFIIIASTCTHGDVRLFGGYTDNDGVAELCIGGVWADVCYENVTEHAVRSFCRQFIGTEPCNNNVTSIQYHLSNIIYAFVISYLIQHILGHRVVQGRVLRGVLHSMTPIIALITQNVSFKHVNSSF